jgi:hypothetical protein
VPVALIATFLLFTNLHRPYLWADEGDTAVLASSIVRNGVPSAWDGTTFTDSDYGTRLNDSLVMVRHPLLQYYLTAASFAVIGETAFAARLPFALLALATILLVYLLVFHVSRDERAALAASVLLTLSVQFLLYGRQSRYYAATAFLSVLLVFVFLHMRSWLGTIAFTVVALLLFQSHPMGLAPAVGMAVLTLAHKPFAEQRKWFWRAAPVIGLLAVPWLRLSISSYVDRLSGMADAETYVARIAQFGVETASVTPVIGAIGLWLLLRRRARNGGRRKSPSGEAPRANPALPERSFQLLLLAAVVSCGLGVAATQTRETIFTTGLRYSAAVIPFVMMMTGLLAARMSRGRWPVWIAVVLVLGFTKLGRVTPLTFWEESTPLRHLDAFVTFHNPERLVDRIFRTGQIGYVQGLFARNRGTVARIAEYLGRYSGPNDIVITNYAWEPLYFHTDLPQGLKILPSYPIWDEAQALHLPPYVFSTQGVRWVVWRRAWGAYRGHDIEAILRQITERGAVVTPATEIAETVWENRENVHFRRFPGNRYVFGWFDAVPSTVIFRVDWPAAAGGPLFGGRAEP